MLSAVAASAAAGAALSGPPGPTGVEAQLQAEIDGMRETGLPAGHPKVRMLEEDLAELRAVRATAPGPAGRRRRPAGRGTGARGRRLPGGCGRRPAVGVGRGRVRARARPAQRGRGRGGGLRERPQPDGTNRYVAVGPDGVARTVAFGADGQVRRLADTPLAAPPAPGEAVAPTPEGDLRVGARVVDVG